MVPSDEQHAHPAAGGSNEGRLSQSLIRFVCTASGRHPKVAFKIALGVWVHRPLADGRTLRMYGRGINGALDHV
jgi:hypothetical protein